MSQETVEIDYDELVSVRRQRRIVRTYIVAIIMIVATGVYLVWIA